jgi:hypothetical protein
LRFWFWFWVGGVTCSEEDGNEQEDEKFFHDDRFLKIDMGKSRENY